MEERTLVLGEMAKARGEKTPNNAFFIAMRSTNCLFRKPYWDAPKKTRLKRATGYQQGAAQAAQAAAEHRSARQYSGLWMR